jgi:hypothetical protein
MMSNDLADVIFESVAMVTSWLARHLTIMVASTALVVIAYWTQVDVGIVQSSDQEIAQLGRDLDNVDSIGEGLSALDAAQLQYSRTRTPSYREQRDSAVMHTYLALRSVRRSMTEGQEHDLQWNELTQLVSAKIDNYLADTADLSQYRPDSAYAAEARLFVLVQRIQREQLKRLRDEQTERIRVERTKAIELKRALAYGLAAVLLAALVDARSRVGSS